MIYFKNKFIIIIITILISVTNSYADQFTYRIKPVSLSYSPEGSLNATFGLACNATFLGMAYFIAPDHRTLLIGATERIGTKLCAGFERTRVVDMSEIDPSTYKPESITAKQAGQRVLFYHVQQIRDTPLSPDHSLLQVSYETTCHPRPVGLLLSKNRPSTSEATIISLFSDKSKDILIDRKSDCPTQVNMIKLRLASRGHRLKVDLLNVTPRDLEKVYRVKQAYIDTSSVQISPDFGVAFKYKRLCNEAPIGMAISKKIDGSLGISMIVASYYNDRCRTTTKYSILSSFRTLNIKMDPAKVFVDVLAQPLPKVLRIIRPNQYLTEPRGGINIKLLDDCQTSQSIIVGDSNQRDVFLGILQNASATGCKNKLKEVSWYLPYVQLRPLSKVRPLALWGTI